MSARSFAVRRTVKHGLGAVAGRRAARGATVLIYHRVGGGTTSERDVTVAQFEAQLDVLAGRRVLSLDGALDAAERGDDGPSVVLSFDDGFHDVYARAWPLLRDRGMPFTVYVASAFMGAPMVWEGSTARDPTGVGLTWEQLAEMAASPLCTIGNHTHGHVPPTQLTADELDRCSDELEHHLGLRPSHFAYPWGIPVPAAEALLRARFRSAATGEIGRLLPGTDPIRLPRVPVRATDPVRFFTAKLRGRLGPERAYAAVTGGAKRVGVRG